MATILVMGYSRSSKAVINLLKKDYQILVSDTIKHEEVIENVTFILQNEILSYLDKIYVVVKSPGIPYYVSEVQAIMAKQIPIYTEIEIAYQKALNFQYVAITGTNGKTTTASLTYHLLKTSMTVELAGNIGIALSEIVSQESKTIVLELSNFQLLGIETFKPHIATILNLTPDHLDYMKSEKAYYQSKTKIYQNQTKDDYFLLNIDDEKVVEYCQNIPATIIRFSTKQKTDAYYQDGKIYYHEKEIADLSHFHLVGEHNIQNALVAVLTAYLLKVKKSVIEQQLSIFQSVKHRLQYLGEKNGVLFYNDSKATNPEACETALKAFALEHKILLLAGGYDKKISFDILKQYNNKIKKAYVFGEVKNQLTNIFTSYQLEDTMLNALQSAYQEAEAGDIILLSPACASYDQFKSFEERGDIFIRAVEKLIAQKR